MPHGPNLLTTSGDLLLPTLEGRADRKMQRHIEGVPGRDMDDRGLATGIWKEAAICEQSPIEVAARVMQQIVPPAGAKERILRGLERDIQRRHARQQIESLKYESDRPVPGASELTVIHL